MPGIDKAFLKKGNKIYHRDGGYKTVVDKDLTQELLPDNAKIFDTFSKQKVFPDYFYPLTQ